MTEIGIDWSFSPLWILGFVSLFAVLLFWHGKSLLQALTSSTAWKLIFLRFGVMLFVLLLLVKPYLITQENRSCTGAGCIFARSFSEYGYSGSNGREVTLGLGPASSKSC